MWLQYSSSPVEYITELFLSPKFSKALVKVHFLGVRISSGASYVANKSFCDACIHAVVKLHKSVSNIVRESSWFMWETN